MQQEDKTIKLRYCKYCGTPLPQNSGKCFHCGKNNFRVIPPKLTTSSVLAVVLAIGLALVCVASYYQSVEIAELSGVIEKNKSAILRLNADILSGEKRQKAMSKRLDDTNERAAKYLEKAIFLDEHITIVTTTGEKYHKYGCQYAQGSFYIYDMKEIKKTKYTPCATCY